MSGVSADEHDDNNLTRIFNFQMKHSKSVLATLLPLLLIKFA